MTYFWHLLTSISIFLLFLFYLLNVNNHTRLLGWTTWPVKGGNTIQRNHHCDKGINNRYNLLILFSIQIIVSRLLNYFPKQKCLSKQGVTLYWEHVFDFFFSLFPILQNKGFIDVNLHANSYTVVCLFIYLRTSFRAQKKIRCLNDFCRKHL